jgi:hypothetical protein
MTIEEAVREELRDAYQEEVRLFATLMQSLNDREKALFIRHQMQDAAQKVADIRTILHGVLQGQRILKERTSGQRLNITSDV